MRYGSYLYPWDVVDDAAAPERIAALGVDQVSIAAAYHAVRAVTPFHPHHRVVVAEHAAAYFSPSPAAPVARPAAGLRPGRPGWMADPDSFGTAAEAMRSAGVAVNAWVVLTHNSHLGAAHPDLSVVNAYGDRYPWALCVSHEEVAEYAARLVADIVANYPVAGLELEACGWMGFEHGSHHDKTGLPRDGVEGFLLSTCWCAACAAGLAAAGNRPADLRGQVRAALDPMLRGEPVPAPASPLEEWATIENLLGTEAATALITYRTRAADRFRDSVRRAARSARTDLVRLLLHADPRPHHTGAYTGIDLPAQASTTWDGYLFPFSGPIARVSSAVTTAARTAPAAAKIIANLPAVARLRPQPEPLATRAAAAIAAGATELRFYHAGLSDTADLATIQSVIATQPLSAPRTG